MSYKIHTNQILTDRNIEAILSISQISKLIASQNLQMKETIFVINQPTETNLRRDSPMKQLQGVKNMNLRISRNRQQWFTLITKSSHVIAVLLILISVCSINSFASIENRKGGYLGAAYSVSDIETINKTNGNLYLNIPLASLPAGKGGQTAGISLYYNSKLWKATSSFYQDDLGYTHTNIDPEIDENGGWRYGLKYFWRMRTRFDDAPYPYPNDPSACSYDDNRYAVVSEMVFPDGSTHVIHPRGEKEIDGYTNIRPNGFEICGSHSSGARRFYTTDGSYIHIDFFPTATPSNNPAWTMYFPDGRKVTDDGQGLQRSYDRNGNYVEISATTINGNPATKMSDQLGREILVEYDAANNKDYIYQKGFNSEELKTTVEWGSVSINRQYEVGDSDQDGNPITRTLSRSIRTIQKIQLPTQIGGFSYTFQNDPSITSGQITSLILPSGAIASYSYSLDGTSVLGAMSYVSNGITGKTLAYNTEYDGGSTLVNEKWIYASSFDQTPNISSVTNPDGTKTTDYYIQPDFASTTYVFTGLEYLPFKTENSNGSKIERIWQLNKIPNRNSVKQFVGNYAEQTNAQVKTEFASIPDVTGNPVKTAIKDHKYDKNGNVIEIIEYDFVDYNLIPRDSSGKPTGLPSGITATRITQSNYHNSTPDSTDAVTDSPNIYVNSNSPNLNNLVAAVEIKDGSGTVVSRSEMTYDNLSTTGNLIEARTWDSSKGGYSNPLTSDNSISMNTQYDSYGNPIQMTDAKGIVSKLIYGSITTPTGTVTDLYPTQTVAAFGTPEARTTNTEYDFSTGAVKKVTDVDNNVSTETEYDALARPTKVKAAVGTANEIWMQTVYDDVNRRVISKSDIETKGDARKVAIQHFDQLGRVRLTRTLEDATTQSATDETQGIKVQTRYKYDNPTDPANSNGSYTLVSNPYRAATSAQAASEEGMGWSLSYTDKTGRSSTAKTFGEATLPAPFGANANLTGTVTTQIDTNTTTVTDQAGKQRRSITNALGQLSRVDEPSDAGNLGSVDSPVQPTSYLYDTLGKMVKVTQGVQSRFFKYDSLGRLLRIRQPEQDINASLAVADSISGNNDWSAGFTYDANGNLLTATDTKGIVITSTYDNLNRVTSRSYSDSTPQVTYSYDDPNIQFSKGLLTKTSNSVSSSEILSLDNLGRVLSSRQTTDGINYDSSYSYNLTGALVEETYPSGRKVRNTFQTDSDLAKIETMQAGGSYQARADNFNYAAHGAIKHLQIGNGLWESAQFNNRLQVTQLGLGTSAADTSQWKLDYDFGTTDNNGNIKAQTVTSPVGTYAQSFTYDSLDRLKTANETSGGNTTWTQSFTYDRYGNRTGFSQTLAGNTTNTTPSIDQNTNRFNLGQGYTYDAAGNVITDSQGRQFTFNGDNKQIEVKDSANNTVGTYFYDGDGKRIKKVTGSETTTFVYSGGKLIAEYQLTASTPQAATTQYLGTDMLGSPRVVSDQTGAVTSRRDFMPFGEDLTRANYASDTIRQKFTGYEKDTETGLDFAEARYYNSNIGRFTAVDPLLASGKSADPQTFNRYTYVGNNPINITDPAGLDWGSRYNEKTKKMDYQWFDGSVGNGWSTVDFGVGNSSLKISNVCENGGCNGTAYLYKYGGWDHGERLQSQQNLANFFATFSSIDPKQIAVRDAQVRAGASDAMWSGAAIYNGGAGTYNLGAGAVNYFGGELPYAPIITPDENTTAAGNLFYYGTSGAMIAQGGFGLYRGIRSGINSYQGFLSGGNNLGERLFMSETFGITSSRFGSTGVGVKASWNTGGSLFKAGWSSAKNGGGLQFRIGILPSKSNPNIASFHLYVPRTVVPHTFTGPAMQVKQSLTRIKNTSPVFPMKF